jgi:eukaryotic-like serine/threonine-protein kinase
LTLLGKYEILGQLGTGSMGVVYRAHDSVLDRDVALKVMRDGPHVEPEMRERFYREARTCAHLHHPNIVTIYDL